MKFRVITAALLILIIVVSSACGLLPEEDERLSPPIKEARSIDYRTDTVIVGDISKVINLFAQWKAANRIIYSFSEYNAPFLEFYVQPGDVVKAGDLLAALDIGDIEKDIRDQDLSYQSAKLSYDRTKERFDAGTVSQYDLRIAELTLQDAENKLNDLLEYKNGSLLVADREGTILTTLNYEKGDMVNTGTSIVTLVENDDLILQGTNSLIRSSGVQVGKEVIIKSNNEEIEGFVSEINGNLVTIEPSEIKSNWELGTTVIATIPIDSAANVLLVHRNAIKTVGSRSYVRVLTDGVAIERTVELGISSGSYFEVISGLSEGEVVILN
ncbi:MAG TPA: hypothetical protein PLP30_04715 [Clostridia bacterium]|nr:hypothetical protein [Clostridia bacterium]HRX42112.1 hypothetical protein [Clostridia bacterium]